MAIEYTNAVRDCQTVRGHEKSILRAIADRINGKTHICWPGVALLADDCGLNKRTVMKYVDQLVAKGILVIEQQARGTRSRRYSIDMAKLRSGASDAPLEKGVSGAICGSSGVFGARSGASDAPKPELEPKERTVRAGNEGMPSLQATARKSRMKKPEASECAFRPS